jgi:outer membrane protein assembly factor BamB
MNANLYWRAAALAAALILAGRAAAQDWPGWRGPARDGRLAGFQPPARWPEKLERAWQVQVGGGHATPALVAGRLYVHARQGEDEVVLCLDAETGKEIWKDRVPAPYKPEPSAESHGTGPFASPAVTDGRVFTFGITGILSCLDAATGKVLWRQDFRDRFPKPWPEWGAAASPLVDRGLLIVQAGGKNKGAVLALEAGTGKVRWSWDGDGPGYASPVAAEIGGKRQILTQTQNHAVGLSAEDGRLLWKIEYKTEYEQNSVTPVVLDNLVILSGYRRGVTAWRLEGDSPAQAWHTDEVSMYMSTPLLKGDRLFGFSEKRRGQFFCLNARTGETLWTGDGRQGENAALLDAGTAILALITEAPNRKDPAQLVVFDASDKDYTERARWTVADGPAWAHPVVSGRAIFVKDGTSLARWTIP